MNLLNKFSSGVNDVANRLISSHVLTFLQITFITVWLLAKLDLMVLALILSVEGVFIWTVVLKSTEKIRQGQEKKERFENKRFREFLEEDIKVTQQNLKISREVFLKLQESDYKIEELKNKVESLSKEVTINFIDKGPGHAEEKPDGLKPLTRRVGESAADPKI